MKSKTQLVAVEHESGNGGWQASERLSEASEYQSRVASNHVTRNQDLQASVELFEIECHGSRVETPSLYRRGRQSDPSI